MVFPVQNYGAIVMDHGSKRTATFTMIFLFRSRAQLAYSSVVN
jgi:hypothetical protein